MLISVANALKQLRREGRPTIDVGASVLTGIRSSALTLAGEVLVSNPIMETVPLSVVEATGIGSDFVRAGFLYDRPVLNEDRFKDEFGIEWLSADGAPAPLNHPLEHADLAAVVRYPRPRLPDIIQVPKKIGAQQFVVADAPCPGLLDMCFGLRNAWQFMDDITGNWRVASALLDWALETIVIAYEGLLSALPVPPDIVVYGDDYGFSGGMFISELDFRNFIRPRLRTLVSRLRRLTPASICFHSCGAIRPILGDISELGFEIVNLDPNAKSMIIGEIRREFSRDMIFHGTTDLVALGNAVRHRNMASIGILACELACSAPTIAAPIDVVSTPEELSNLALGTVFVRALSDQDFVDLRDLGPVRKILQLGTEAALASPISVPRGGAQDIIDLRAKWRGPDVDATRSSAGAN